MCIDAYEYTTYARRNFGGDKYEIDILISIFHNIYLIFWLINTEYYIFVKHTLLEKLFAKKISGYLFHRIWSFFTDRTMSVSVYGAKNMASSVSSGVSQVSDRDRMSLIILGLGLNCNYMFTDDLKLYPQIQVRIHSRFRTDCKITLMPCELLHYSKILSFLWIIGFIWVLKMAWVLLIDNKKS